MAYLRSTSDGPDFTLFHTRIIFDGSYYLIPFSEVHFKFLEEKYMFNKYLIPGPYLMNLISCDLFSKVSFKYLEAK